MTREEASNILDDYDVNFDGHTAEEIAKAFDVAFRALGQEPCEDAISRDEVLLLIQKIKDQGHINYMSLLNLAAEVRKLPPVNSQTKVGHWVLGGYDDNYYICDRCNYKASEYYFKPHYKYCPNCGAMMIESQESEEV